VERNKSKRSVHKQVLEELENTNHIVIFQDECGIQEDIVRPYGRCARGKVLFGEKLGTKHKRTGIISGYTKLPDKDNYLYIAPYTYSGNCDTILFNHWLKTILVPEVKLLKQYYPDNPISLVMDNVPYHKSKTTENLCQEHNINLVFQSPYSPDLNPIEPSWDTTKNEIRSQSYDDSNFYQKLTKALLTRTWGV
jgi:transposase